MTQIIKAKHQTLPTWEALLGSYEQQVKERLTQLAKKDTTNRIWSLDHTVWKPEPTEITNRLGWLDVGVRMVESLPEIGAVVQSVVGEGITQVVLLGMGGSSLAPELFGNVFGPLEGYPTLTVLDSTHPDSVLAMTQEIDLSKTLFVVSTKSGGTVETLSFFKHFYNKCKETFGEEEAGKHFIAITDPGSKLEALATKLTFRALFLNDPNIGGRFSVLSYFGIVPAALAGVDVHQLLNRAIQASLVHGETSNLGYWLGAVMGELAESGRDKLTLYTSQTLQSFGDWVEQLLAESTGKEGKGILPVVREPFRKVAEYSHDRFFVTLELQSDEKIDLFMKELVEAGHPVIRIKLADLYDLGGQFFAWEMATAVASHVMTINPFDQPNVESAKVQARAMVAQYQETGVLPAEEATLKIGDVSVFGAPSGGTVGEVLDQFLKNPPEGGYVVFQVYAHTTEDLEEALAGLRASVLSKTGLATSHGYGPRFLHSTGQLHKGDGGKGLFVQITTDPSFDLPIPDEPGKDHSGLSFGTLVQSQAMGDKKALEGEGRKVLRFHTSTDKVLSLVKELT